ncbi:MAG: hypothetical protein FJ023_08600 [Chloroflexi bacterium]|nr:hypothetical protein [Chloroflexota bacterium]
MTQPEKGKRAKSPRNKKTEKASRKTGVPWGRAGSAYRPGEFIHIYLTQHDEACCADVFYALKQDLKRINQERVEIGDKPIKGCTYNSFAKYWHWFKKLGLIEPTGRSEPACYDFLEDKRYYRLSAAGVGEEIGWNDPIRAAHPEFR